jgi:hypothetical protein
MGCGANATKVSFDLPAQTLTFDPGVLVPGGGVPAVPCTSTSYCCMLVGGCTTSLQLDCESNGTSMLCTALVPVIQTSNVFLKNQVPALSTASSIDNMTVDQFNYAVSANTLNIDLPAMSIELASPLLVGGPSTKLFGTIPLISNGTVPSGPVMLASDAGATFTTFAHDLSLPFNMIVETTLHVSTGPYPMGTITITLTGTLSGWI